MSLRDIIYLDSERLTSLLSQLLGGVSEHGREAEVDSSRNDRVLRDDEKHLGSSVSQHVERVREVRYFDHLLTMFLENLGGNIVELASDDIRDQTEKAFRRGSVVKATGPLFLDDFGGIGAALSASPKYFDVMQTFSTATPKATLGALASLKTGSKEARQQLEAEKQKQRATIAAAEAHLKGLRETFAALGSAVEAFFGNAVECGVVLEGDPAVLVRALLDRSWLREPAPSLIQRYGTRSAAQFSVIGTVTKASWIAPPRLTIEERAAADSVAVGGNLPPESKTIETNSVRGAILAAQTVFEQVREMVMTVGSGDSVSVAPLVVFRSLDVKGDAPAE